jgi:hypothetical protein
VLTAISVPLLHDIQEDVENKDESFRPELIFSGLPRLLINETMLWWKDQPIDSPSPMAKA